MKQLSLALAVVASGGAGVGVAGGVLDVLEGDTGLAGAGNERDAEGVGADLPGRAGERGVMGW